MISLDTNVLLRYLIDDNKKQREVVISVIERYVGKENSIFINNIVLCELIWVLSSGYEYSKEQMVTLLYQMLTTKEFAFEDAEILLISLEEYEHKALDFSDVLIAKFNKYRYNSKVTITFDKKACKIPEFTNIENF